MTDPQAAAVRQVIAAIPHSWLDPLLTGPDAVIGHPPYACPDIERLLRAIRQRVAAGLEAALGEAPASIRRYQGRIEVGMHFIWEPNIARAYEHIIVSRVESRSPDEPIIWTRRADGRKFKHPDKLGEMVDDVWNEEGRFREACVPCDERGVLHGGEAPASPPTGAQP